MNTSPRLQGKVAIITGASSGIGKACALAFAKEGAKLVLVARRLERLEAIQRDIKSIGSEALIIQGDVREENTAINAVNKAIAAFSRIDILINNVGIGLYKKLVDTSAAEYDEMMSTNVRSSFLFTRQVVPTMQRQKSGTILLISSMAGLYGIELTSQPRHNQCQRGKINAGLASRL